MGVMADEEIYRKYSDDLVRFATGLVGPFDAQDVVTDACLRSFRAKEWPQVGNRARIFIDQSSTMPVRTIAARCVDGCGR